MVRARAVRLAAGLLFVSGVPFAAEPVTASIPPSTVDAETVPAGLDPAVLSWARSAYERVRSDGRATRPRLTVIDYRKPSTEKRLWVLDMESGAVLFHELVAHGNGTGENLATRFGNEPGSNRTSLGVFVTAETYIGKHGYSLRLDGLEPGFNDRARDRAIVVHGADYATAEFARKVGRLGRSQGCPAVDPSVSRALIDAIEGGSVLVAYGADPDWLAGSPFAGAAVATRQR